MDILRVKVNNEWVDIPALVGPQGESGNDPNAVHFNESQSLTDAQKSTARNNIGAASTGDITTILANFAGAFVQTTAYPAGTYVTYTDGNLYLLSNGHEADATWANTTKTQVSVGGELSDLKSALSDVSESLGKFEYTQAGNGVSSVSDDKMFYYFGDILETGTKIIKLRVQTSDVSTFKFYIVNLAWKVVYAGTANVTDGINELDVSNVKITEPCRLLLQATGLKYDSTKTPKLYFAINTFYTLPSVGDTVPSKSFSAQSCFGIDLVYAIDVAGDIADLYDKTADALGYVKIDKSKNLFNKNDSDIVLGKYLGNDGTMSTASTCAISEYIIAKAGQTFSKSRNDSLGTGYMGGYYDGNKIWLGNISGSVENSIETFTLPNDNRIAFIRVNIKSANIDSTMVAEGGNSDFPSSYTAFYDRTAPRQDIGLNDKMQSQAREIAGEVSGGNPWYGKEWYAFGTSISDYATGQVGQYPPYLVVLSGMNYHNKAYSGGCIGYYGDVAKSQILNMIDAATLTSADLVTVEGFVNDWSQSVPIGDNTDTTNETLKGAIYQAITKILAKSNALIVFITDSTGKLYNSTDLRRTVQRNGKTQNDYIEATIEMCHYMNIPVIDAGRKSMISQDTASMYITDQIHHTLKGGEQYANTIWNELKNIKPRVV